MAVISDLLNLALTDAGVAAKGQTPDPDDTRNALLRLNMMIAQWAAERWVVYHLIDVHAPMTGAQSYGVGPGLAFDTVRPDAIEAAFLRQLSPSTATPIDYPLRVISSYEDYAAIRLKTLQASPAYYVFLDSGWPTGLVYPYPIPDSRFEMHLIFKQPLQVIGAVTDTVDFPPAYHAAIYSNLVVRLCAAYKLKLDPTMKDLARGSMSVIRTSNAQVPTLDLPTAVLNPKGAAYNIWSDQ